MRYAFSLFQRLMNAKHNHAIRRILWVVKIAEEKECAIAKKVSWAARLKVVPLQNPSMIALEQTVSLICVSFIWGGVIKLNAKMFQCNWEVSFGVSHLKSFSLNLCGGSLCLSQQTVCRKSFLRYIYVSEILAWRHEIVFLCTFVVLNLIFF